MIYGLANRVRFVAEKHRSYEVRGLERRGGIEQVAPALFPSLQKAVPGIAGVNHERLVAFAVWSVAIRGEEILPPGLQVAADVLDHQRNAIAVLVQNLEEVLIRDLSHGCVAMLFQSATLTQNISLVLLLVHADPIS